MIAVIKQPCSRPEIVDIGSDFMDLRNVVGGGLEHYGFGHGIGILCDIEGRNKGNPFNFRLDDYVDFVGPALFVGEGDEDFIGLTDEQIMLVLSFFGEERKCTKIQ